MGSQVTAVRYEVLREYSDEKGVMQDIIVLDDVENKEIIERLGRQLDKQFRDKLIVAVNVFEYAGSGARNSRAAATHEKAGMGHAWRITSGVERSAFIKSCTIQGKEICCR